MSCNFLKHTLCRLLSMIIVIALPIFFGGCVSTTAEDIDAGVADAEQFLSEGHPDQAAKICSRMVIEEFDRLNENQLGRLAVILMKLPESENTAENVADATQCIRQAWKLSSDSMRGFISTLPPEDLPHFVMLTRISGSIDFPPDLSEETFVEDSVDIIGEN